MAKRASKSQFLIPFRTALDIGYKYLHNQEEFRGRIKALCRHSFENVNLLHNLGIELLDDLTESTQRSAKILTLATHWERLAESAPKPVLPRDILDHISLQLLLHYLRDSRIIHARSYKTAIAIDSARQQYETEMRDFISLVR